MLTLDYKILEDLLLDPVFAAKALMGWDFDDYQGAALKLDWWFPWTIDSSGTMSGKTRRMFALSCLRGMLLEDQVVGCYFPTWGGVGQQEFWPYFNDVLHGPGAGMFRDQCRLHRRKIGETKGSSCWTWHFDNGSRIEMPAPNFLQDARSQAGRSFNTLNVDENEVVEAMGEGISKQLIERARRPLPKRWEGHGNCPIRGNHVHLKGHAEKTSSKGYPRYKSFRKLIREGSSRHATYSFCYRDISERWAPMLRKDEIIRSQKAALSREDFARQILGLWSRDGSTFYPEGVLGLGAQDILPELGRSSNDAHYFLGFDLAPGQSIRADYCAASVLRLRPVPVAELPRLMESGATRFFRLGGTAWELTYVFGWMGRGLRAGELAGFIHLLDQRFNFSLICMDPGGGGQWVKAELLKPEAEWAGVMRRVTPICTRAEPNYHDKRPILHMFRRGGDFDLLPFVGPAFAKGDDGFLAAWHMRFRARWEQRELGYPAPLVRRDKGTVAAFWPGELVAAQRTIDEGIKQLSKVTQQTDSEGHPLVSRSGFSLFYSPTKKDVAYAKLYAFAAGELWLHQNAGGENADDEEAVYD